MNWELVINNDTKKQLKNIPKKDAERAMAAVRDLAVNPYSGDIKKIEGESDVWRRRVGSYRIFYEVLAERKIVYVFGIKRRVSNTY